ncbi:hypothetical protein GGD81_001265 [Rhodobium orientis]|uniref:2,4-dihydroxyhept-2-ene-1,7-dioic acid aldolase n=1 Tax=Rhodobium orientis TaxID=34017 RepID=A0A327K0Q1_9HYPH|nr:DUF2218 domain-containing protein [Rhodobium orientis]MBB4302238.1 hypothetical protein [Rhodobium orientis]MBK5948949.1 hypothetical protein [Rhodobium orientis]RAI28948.1 hypothetical protein CH339_04470 [Rhodobium orientis]
MSGTDAAIDAARLPGVHRVADIATERASRYLQQLAKHFQHKLPVTFDETTGSIAFDGGTCAMAADERALTLYVVAPDAAEADRLADVIERHLVRFAFRDEMDINWRAG